MRAQWFLASPDRWADMMRFEKWLARKRQFALGNIVKEWREHPARLHHRRRMERMDDFYRRMFGDDLGR